jgi:protein-disulfide isomerase
MRHLLAALLTLIAWLAWSGLASAQTRECDALKDAKRATAVAVLKSQHPYDCCDGTIWECLHRKPVCRLARRMARDVCQRAGAGQSREEIERELTRRATSMMPGGTTYAIDTTGATAAGDAAAPVTLVAYACGRCPFCARLLPQLYQSVTTGRLKGKVKLYVRLFPIRSHPNSTEVGLALVAAQRLGKFWEMVGQVYANFGAFDVARLPDYAVAAGMDRQKFVGTMNAPATRDQLVKSKKEGVRNNVASTPTLFIGGRKYSADLGLDAVEDALEEEYERVKGQQTE